MKKYIILILSVFAFAVSGMAQEKMNLLMKNGSVVSYNVEDIQSFYFTDGNQNQQLAENCGITINDELALTDKFALDLTYESGVEYIMVGVYAPENYDDAIGDDAIVSELETKGVRIDKSTTIISAAQMPEGKMLTVVFTGYNNEGKHGPVYRHHIQTHIEADEAKAVVTSCLYDSNNFIFSVEMDGSKAQRYYLFEEVGDNTEMMNTAVLGMLWRRAIATDPEKGLYNTGKTFTKPRPNGETQLYVATWALDFSSQYSGYIFDALYETNASAPMMRADLSNNKIIVGYNKEECLQRIRNMTIY